MLEAFSEYDNLNQDELHAKLFEIDDNVSHLNMAISEEDYKFQRYKVNAINNLQVENERRQHNYIPLIFELLKNMAEKNILEDVYNEAKIEESKKK